jgi:predicted metal-binding membrane protein
VRLRLASAGLLRRERVVVLLALAGVTAIAWGYLFTARRDMDMSSSAMSDMPDMAMPFDAPWVFAMWWVMMLGMMLPSAAPMILTFDALQRRRCERGEPNVPTILFVAGYLIVWGGFSLAATAAQAALRQGALLTPMLALASPVVGGALFILAGTYQFTPLKYACLRQCRSPFAFVLNHWHDGWNGALRMGAGHGLYCLGCCWILMALLFAVGVMNLLWVAAIAVFVFAEKLLPFGVWVGRAGGCAMAAFGVFLLTQ